MKKLLTLFAAMLMCMCAAIPAHAGSRSDLAETCTLVNKECPMDLGDGMSIKSVKLINNDVVMLFSTQFAADEIELIKSMEDAFVDMLLSEFRTDEDTRSLIALCKDAKCNIVFRLSNAQGKYADLKLSYTKM